MPPKPRFELTLRQVIETAWPGDAVTNMALNVHDRLSAHMRCEIFAWGVHPELSRRVRPAQELPEPSLGDVLIYHLSIGRPELTRTLMERDEPLILVYHNITPPEQLLDEPDLALRCEWGRYELAQLRERVHASLAVSPFNACEMRAIGYEPVVAPLGVDPRRLLELPRRDLTVAERQRLGKRYVLVVAQLLPHKRVEIVIHALHLLTWYLGVEVGLAVVGYERDAPYAAALNRTCADLELNHVWFTGRTDDETLAALYQNASALVSASAHEGLGLPLWEAMSFDVPVVAIGNAAVPDTIGDGGLVLPAGAGPELLAEALSAVFDDTELAGSLRTAGRRRLSEMDPESSTAALLDLVRSTL